MTAYQGHNERRSPSKGYGNLALTAASAVWAKTRRFPRAAQLIELLTDKHGMALWDRYAVCLPARKSLSCPASGKVFMEQVPHCKDLFFPPHGATMATPSDNDVLKVMQGNMSASSAVATMQSPGNRR